MGKTEESMPRKSKHGTDIARWGHHEEAKEDRRRNRNRARQHWKKEVEKEAGTENQMIKQQIQTWIGLNCKFAAIDRFANSLVSHIVSANIQVTGEIFSKIVQTVLKEEIARLNPDIKQRLMRALMNISKHKGNLTAIDMMNELKGYGRNPGLLSLFKLPRQTLMDEDIKPLLNEVVRTNRLRDPKAIPHTKETRDIDWEAAKAQETLNLAPRVPARPTPKASPTL